MLLNARLLLFCIFLCSPSFTLLAQKIWDTTYYASCKNRLSLGLIVSDRSYRIGIESDNRNNAVNYAADARSAVGFVADYDKIALAVLFKAKYRDEARKGRSSYNNFMIGIGANRFLLEGSYRYFKGFYDENSGAYLPAFTDTTPFYQAPGLGATLLKLRFYYFMNYKRFSFKSAYSCGYRQTRSASSFILSFQFINERLRGDSAMIPFYLREQYGANARLNGLYFRGLGGGVGVTGTWVMGKKGWFLNGILVPNFQLQQRTYFYDSRNEQRDGVYFGAVLDGRVSLGFNSDRFFMSLMAGNDLHLLRGQGVRFEPSFTFASFMIGYRIGIPEKGVVGKVKNSEIYRKL